MIEALKSIFPKSSWPWIFAALRQDAVIWNTLNDESFGRLAIGRLGRQPSVWSPLALALIAIGAKQNLPIQIRFDQWDENSLTELPDSLKQQVNNLYSNFLQGTYHPAELFEIGLVSLALLERLQQLNDQDKLILELQTSRSDSDYKQPWGSIFACAYKFIPKPIGFLREWLVAKEKDNSTATSTNPNAAVIHALLCQPLSPQEQFLSFQELFTNLYIPTQLHLLQTLESQRPNLAVKMAKYLLDNGDARLNIDNISKQNQTITAQMAQLERINQVIELHVYAKQPKATQELLQQADKLSKKLQSSILSQTSSIAAQVDDPQTAMETWEKVKRTGLEEAPAIQATLALQLIEKGHFDAAQVVVTDELPWADKSKPVAFQNNNASFSDTNPPQQPELLLARALLANHNRQQSEARKFAIGALETYTQLLAENQTERNSHYHQELQLLAELLINLGQADEASKAANLGLLTQSDDPELLLISAKANHAIGAYDKSIQAAQLGVALDPERIDFPRALASSLEAIEDWSSAMNLRTQIATNFREETDCNRDDLHALANCAINAKQPKTAIQALQHALKAKPEDGTTLALMGRAYNELGKNDEAINYYQQAIKVAPSEILPWMALAEQQHRNGQIAEGMDTLRSAAKILPDAPEIYLAIGEACLANDLPTQALPALSQAASLVQLPTTTDYPQQPCNYSPLASRIAYRYGQALYTLDHLEEARQVLGFAQQAQPHSVDIAQTYAQTLLDLNNPKEAIVVLTKVLENNPKEIKPYLIYAQAVLEGNSQPELAIEALRHVLSHENQLNETELNESQALMAEALAAHGQQEEAMNYYSTVSQTSLVKDPKWQVRLALGFGKLSINLGQPKSAINILQKVTQAVPTNPVLSRALSEAYLAAGLKTSALDSARQALEQAPDDLENLLWFSDHAVKLNASQEAVNSLAHAAKITPKDVEQILALGESQLRAGDYQAALATFKKVSLTPEANLDHLIRASRGLLKLDAASEAILCLERARNEHFNISETQQMELLANLAEAYLKAGNTEIALETVEKALQSNPQSRQLLKIKSDIYLQLDDPQTALTYLEQTLNNRPDDYEIHHQVMEILRFSGNLSHALHHAYQMILACKQSTDPLQSLAMRVLAAEFAQASLQPELARSWLEIDETGTSIPNSKINSAETIPSLFSKLTDPVSMAPVRLAYLCLTAELNLFFKEDIAAAEAINASIQIFPDHPRVLALQTRMLIRRGDNESAHHTLLLAKEAAGGNDSALLDIHGVAEAALELYAWDSALELLQRITESFPPEPLAYLNLARTLVLQAEYYQLCQVVQVQNHTPGSNSISNKARSAFNDAIQNASQRAVSYESSIELSGSPAKAISLNSQPIIDRWRIRGQAVFCLTALQNQGDPSMMPALPNSSQEMKQALSALTSLITNGDDCAAYIAIKRQSGDDVNIDEIAADFPLDHQVQVQLALAHLEKHPGEALAAALIAAGNLPLMEVVGLSPIYHAILARAAQLAGDLPRASNAMKIALQFWPDEPRWNGWAAELGLAQKETANVIKYLQKAIELDPEYTPHYLLYAKTLVQTGQQRPTAIKILRHILDTNPNGFAELQPETKAILAEALAANNETSEALQYYQQALDTNLVQNPEWRLRLSLGLADAAMKEGKIDTALAILLDNSHKLSHEYQLFQKLSEVYRANHQISDAQSAARHALELAPSEIENLLWFANQALALQMQPDATNALTCLSQLSPLNIPQLLKLGDIQKRAGQLPNALATFQIVSQDGHANLDELICAAQNLLELNAVSEALSCLEKAQQTYSSAPAQVLVKLYITHIQANMKSGNFNAALEMVEKALEQLPNDSNLLKTKARLYQETKRPQAALACLDQVLNENPNDYEAHEQAMVILRADGNLQKALQHAEQMVRASSSTFDPVQSMCSRVLAAEFAYTLLQPKMANLFLDKQAINESAVYQNTNEWRDYQFLAAELELGMENGFSTTEEFENIIQIDPQHPRSLALQARLMARKGQEESAQQALGMAREAITKSGTPNIIDQYAVVESALDLRNWDFAIDILQRIIQGAPPEPLPYLNMARALVLQAENEKLDIELGVQHHRPGLDALSKETQQLFNFAIQNASQRALTPLVTEMNGPHSPKKTSPISPEIQRWRLRGQVVFNPGENKNSNEYRQETQLSNSDPMFDQNLLEMSKLPANPDDTAAYIAALRSRGKIAPAVLIAKDYPYHPYVQAQLALTLRKQQPEEATKAISAAVENLPMMNTCSITPLFHTLMALCKQDEGDYESAYQAIQKALAYWEDEPTWHDWAADYCVCQNNLIMAAHHLEKCIILENNNPEYYLKLGEVYTQNGAIDQALQAIETANRLAPKQIEPLIALARVHLQQNNFSMAANFADKAISLRHNQIEPSLLRAEIALAAKEPQVAYKYALTALRLQNNHPQALRLLGKTLAALNRPGEAIQTMEKAARFSSNPLPLYLERISIIRQFQGNEDALRELNILIGQMPDDPFVLSMLAEILANTGQEQEAIEAAQRAIQNANDTLDNKQRADLHHLAGRLLSHSGHLDQAVHHLSESVKFYPHQLDYYMDLGQTYQERRQYDRALQVYQQAIRVVPHDPKPYYQAGLALKETKDYSSAEKMIRQAAKLAPDDIRIQRLLGSLMAVNLVHSE